MRPHTVSLHTPARRPPCKGQGYVYNGMRRVECKNRLPASAGSPGRSPPHLRPCAARRYFMIWTRPPGVEYLAKSRYSAGTSELINTS
jgi:hypothetical protein